MLKMYHIDYRDYPFFVEMDNDDGYCQLYLKINGREEIDEDLVQSEMNLVYLKMFLLAYGGIEKIRLGNNSDLSFYADYIFDALEKIREYYHLPYRRPRKEEIIQELRRLIS